MINWGYDSNMRWIYKVPENGPEQTPWRFLLLLWWPPRRLLSLQVMGQFYTTILSSSSQYQLCTVCGILPSLESNADNSTYAYQASTSLRRCLQGKYSCETKLLSEFKPLKYPLWNDRSSPTKRTSQWVLLCCTFLGAATLTLNFLCGTVLSLKLSYYLLINIGKDLSTQEDIAAQKAFIWEVISIWPNQIVVRQSLSFFKFGRHSKILPEKFILSDCIITWRAWVVWPNQIYVKAMILFLAVGNFGKCS